MYFVEWTGNIKIINKEKFLVRHLLPLNFEPLEITCRYFWGAKKKQKGWKKVGFSLFVLIKTETYFFHSHELPL